MLTTESKLTMLKAFMRIDDESEDALLEAYLAAAEQEILNWKYEYAKEVKPETVDAEDEMTQIQAVIAGYNLTGMEVQMSHSENGVSRSFKYSNMVDFIRSHIIPYARISGMVYCKCCCCAEEENPDTEPGVSVTPDNEVESDETGRN